MIDQADNSNTNKQKRMNKNESDDDIVVITTGCYVCMSQKKHLNGILCISNSIYGVIDGCFFRTKTCLDIDSQHSGINFKKKKDYFSCQTNT
jgi:hypothetical protein